MGGEADVRRHYASTRLAARILEALAATGLAVDDLSAELLYPLDQLHGRELSATREHLAHLELGPGRPLLDVGCGIGGPARYAASTFGCRVTGIDLTEELVEAATELTRRCKLDGLVRFEAGDALTMPFADASFAAASCLYVAMNIEDKAALLAQVRRVLRPGGRLVWSEVVTRGAEEPTYPLPWASASSFSFLGTSASLKSLFDASGFRILEWSDETATHIAFAARARATPPSALRQVTNAVVLGEGFGARLHNLNEALADGRLGSVLVIAERPQG